MCVYLVNPTQEGRRVSKIMKLMLRGKCGGTRSSNVVSPEGASWGQAALLYVSMGGTTSHSVFSPKRSYNQKAPGKPWRLKVWPLRTCERPRETFASSYPVKLCVQSPPAAQECHCTPDLL